MRTSVSVAALFVAGALSLAAWGMDQNNKTAVPGSLNYVEGSASIGQQALDSKSVGSAQLETGQSLTTEQGKAELLLTPGVFLRVGNSSAVKMVSPSLTNTEVELDQGQAIIEVEEIHPENNIRIDAGNSTTQLLKTGLYDFDLRRSSLMVFDGKAEVHDGDEHATVKSGHEVALHDNTGKLKAYKFDKKVNEEGDLYRWSSLRSSYLAESNVNAAGLYAVNGIGPWGPGWWGAAWYWDPWFGAFTFIPADGIFYSPFGWGFYSPWLVYQAPFWGYGWGGYGFHPYVHHFGENVHNWGPGSHYVASAGYTHGIYSGAGSAGAFRSGSRGVMGSARASGGLEGGHVGGGGFHGAGFSGGGGFHGR